MNPFDQLGRSDWSKDFGLLTKLTDASELYQQQKAATRAANVAAGLRLFSVSNETAQHLAEVEAFSHEDAARRYRIDFEIAGYACLVTKDAEVFFGLREGNLMLVQHTREPNTVH